MRYLYFILLVSLFSCNSEELSTEVELEGPWNMTIAPEGDQRKAFVAFHNNGTGILTMLADSTSNLLPRADEFYFDWKLKKNELSIQRNDNGFKLNYEVQSISAEYILLNFQNEIKIQLSKRGNE